MTPQLTLPFVRVVRVEVGRHSVWLYGPGVARPLAATDTPRMRCPFQRTWTVPLDRLSDVLAYLDHARRPTYFVDLVEVDR